YQNYGELVGDSEEKEEARQATEAVREQLGAFERGRSSTPGPPSDGKSSTTSSPSSPSSPTAPPGTRESPASAQPQSPLTVGPTPPETTEPRRGSVTPGATLLALGLATVAGGGVLAWLAKRDEHLVETSGTPEQPAPWADWIATDREGRAF